MIPHPFVALVLTLAAFRLTRLIGWDDLPPVERARAWLVGEHVEMRGSSNSMMGLTANPPEMTVTYSRPTLAHFIRCPYCLGHWIACVWYVWWLLEPTSCLYAAAPFALGAAVGIIARQLDP